MKNKWVVIIVAVFVMASVMGCGTMHGVGEDMESAGENVQKW